MPEVTEWKNSTDGSRVYFVTKGEENLLLGIFTNRQKLMQALKYSGLEGCVIRGQRKDREVNDSTIGDEVVFHKRRCDIYNGDKIAYRVGLYYLNNMNPKFIKERALNNTFQKPEGVPKKIEYERQELPL